MEHEIVMGITMVDDVVSAAEKARVSVVSVSTIALVQDYFFGAVHPVRGMGSGVIISKDGHIITNRHVVVAGQKIGVAVSGDKVYEGKVIGMDALTDLAVVKIDTKSLKPAELGDSSKIKVGQTAIAIGNPFGFALGGPTVTTGVISAVKRHIQTPEQIFEDLIQTDAAINPGNSGGALLDISGRVIGINTAVIPYAQGIGFAIPINKAMVVAQEIIDHGRVIRPWLGTIVATTTKEISRQYGLPEVGGILIVKIIEGSPAHMSGLMPGDIIISLDGKKVKEGNQLTEALKKKKVGEKMVFEFNRGGETAKIEVELIEAPQL